MDFHNRTDTINVSVTCSIPLWPDIWGVKWLRAREVLVPHPELSELSEASRNEDLSSIFRASSGLWDRCLGAVQRLGDLWPLAMVWSRPERIGIGAFDLKTMRGFIGDCFWFKLYCHNLILLFVKMYIFNCVISLLKNVYLNNSVVYLYFIA